MSAEPFCVARRRAKRDANYPQLLSEGRVEDEHIGLDVGVGVVAADESNDLAAGEPFDGRSGIGFHRFLEELADVVHDVSAVGSGEGLLRARENSVHQCHQDVAVVKRRRSRGSTAEVFGVDPNERARDRGVQLPACELL